MQLEHQLKSRFRSLPHKCSVNIIYTHNWLTSRFKRLLRKEGLTMQQYNLLRILCGSQPKALSIKVIRERMLDRMSDVSRIVEKLRKRGLLDRCANPEDRRNVDVRITKEGLERLASMDAHEEVMDEFFEPLSAKEMHLLNTLLDRLRSQ